MSEKDWQAQEDARTLAESIAIKKDPDRMKKASAAAKDMLADERLRAEESKTRAKAMEHLAGGKKSKKGK